MLLVAVAVKINRINLKLSVLCVFTFVALPGPSLIAKICTHFLWRGMDKVCPELTTHCGLHLTFKVEHTWQPLKTAAHSVPTTYSQMPDTCLEALVSRYKMMDLAKHTQFYKSSVPLPSLLLPIIFRLPTTHTQAATP